MMQDVGIIIGHFEPLHLGKSKIYIFLLPLTLRQIQIFPLI